MQSLLMVEVQSHLLHLSTEALLKCLSLALTMKVGIA